MTLSTASVRGLIPPCGGDLVDLRVPPEAAEHLRAYATRLPSLLLSERSVCDLELLAVGGLSPSERFLGKADYQRVLDEMRLTTGQVFPVPITLPVSSDAGLRLDRDVALRNSRNEVLAILTVDDIYDWSPAEAADKLAGARGSGHPLIAEMRAWGPLNVTGRLQVLQLPRHYDFQSLRLTPSETRARLARLGKANVIAANVGAPEELPQKDFIQRVAGELDAILLLHPLVGLSRADDMSHFTRVRVYKAAAERYYEASRTLLALLPLAGGLEGPREALWRGLVGRNYGANHLSVGGTSPGDAGGAGQAIDRLWRDLGVVAMPLGDGAASPDKKRRIAESELAALLTEVHPPRGRQGLCVWLTGLSGAGKSTTAEVLTTLLLERGRQVTVLDGDVVRTHLSHGLGFSRADRDINIRRIGFVAAEIVRHGGVVIVAAVSPYAATRNDVRSMVGAEHFIEVFVDTPLGVCEQRDMKGMYAKARRGELKGLTGIDDPYEAPLNPEIALDAVSRTVEQNADRIVKYLLGRGLISDPA